MSFIPNFIEANQWLNSWMAEVNRGSQRAVRHIQEAAKEQRANLEAIKHRGFHSEIRIPEYERSVRMIERASAQLRHSQFAKIIR